MDLFRDIKKGKKFTPKELKKEASHELKELGGEKVAEAHEKKVKMAGRMKKAVYEGRYQSHLNPEEKKQYFSGMRKTEFGKKNL